MRVLFFFILLSPFNLLNAQSECSEKYEQFNKNFYNNIQFTRSSAVLIKEYNSLGDCAIDKKSRNYIEKHLEKLIILDSILCSFEKTKNKSLLGEVSKIRPVEREDKMKTLYDNTVRVINGVISFPRNDFCEIEKIQIIKDGRVLGEERRNQSNQKDLKKQTFSKTGSSEPNAIPNLVDDKTQSNSNKSSSEKILEPSHIDFKPINTTIGFNEIAMDSPKLFLTGDKHHFLEFCYVAKGNFNLGITSNQYSEILMEAGDKAFDLNVQDEVTIAASRYVKIDESFHISKFELSEDQYNLIMNGTTNSQGNDKAKTNFSGQELKQLLEKLNNTYPKLVFDIPNEIEWEFAAKGASENFYISTNDYFEIDEQVVVDDSIGLRSIHFQNELCSWINACNMIGNAKEICYANHKYYTSNSNTNNRFVARGGSYVEDRFSARTTSRHLKSNVKSEDVGIRLIIKKKK